MSKNNFSIAENKYYYPFVDGLRGIAILLVLLVHTSQTVASSPGEFRFSIIESFINAGARGVQLFFIISSFTLFTSSKERYGREKYPKISFYIRRIFRIIPFWWIMLFLCGWYNGIYDISRYLTNMFFLFGFTRHNQNVEIILGGWSLFVEETFYILLPFVFYYVSDFFKSFKFFLITLIVSIVWQRVFHRFVPSGNAFVFLFPLAQWFCFSLGIMIYFIATNVKFKKVVLENNRFNFVLDSLAIIFLMYLFPGDFMISSFALMIMFVASIPEKSFFGRITRNRLLMRFGVYCYSIYLFEFPLLYALQKFQKPVFAFFGLSNSWIEIRLLLWFLIVSIISIVIAHFTYNLIEKPCVKLGKNLINRINSNNILSFFSFRERTVNS